MKRALGACGPIVAYAALIFFLSAQQGLSRELPDHADKVIHLAEFGVFGFLLARALRLTSSLPPRTLLVLTVAIGALYGASDEWHQSFVPGRDASVLDAVADLVGSVVGAVAYVPMLRRAPRGAPS